MNYFLNTWGGPLFFVRISLLFVLLMGIALLVSHLLKRLGLSESWSNGILFVTVLATLWGILFGAKAIMNQLIDGRVKMLYIIEHNGQPALKIGLVRKNSRRVIIYLTYKFKTYDLKTGKFLKLDDLGEQSSIDGDYAIFGSYGENPIAKDWIYNWARNSEGKNARRRNTKRPTSAKPAYLLKPELIRELNPKAQEKNKTWLQHHSTLFGPFTYLVTYVDQYGQKLNQLDLNEMFKDKKTKAIATLSNPDEVLLFITRNDFTLTALRTDPQTGKIIGRIDYLK